MFAVCWHLLASLELVCGPLQPKPQAESTLRIEMMRYDTLRTEFYDLSPPIVLPESALVRIAQMRLAAHGGSSGE